MSNAASKKPDDISFFFLLFSYCFIYSLHTPRHHIKVETKRSVSHYLMETWFFKIVWIEIESCDFYPHKNQAKF